MSPFRGKLAVFYVKISHYEPYILVKHKIAYNI